MPTLAPVDRPEGAGIVEGVVVGVAPAELVVDNVDATLVVDRLDAEPIAADDVGTTVGAAGGVVSL